jgi:hypothetical protein
MDLDALADVARALLRVAPADFVGERAERVRELRGADRELAAAVGKLRKPAPAAWVIDLLAVEGALDEAVDLGPSLRAAQEHADPTEIATLRKERTRVVTALARDGAGLAADAGHEVADAVLAQVRATIEAAMADQHAGAAVRSGLLVRALESVGFDAVDLDGALAVPDAVPDAWSGADAEPIPITAGRRGAASKRAPAGKPADVGKAGRASRPAERAKPSAEARAAERAAERDAARAAETDAREASRAADRAVEEADDALDAAEQTVADLERRRDEIERDLAAAHDGIPDLERARDDAEAAATEARNAFAAARKRRREVR